MKDAADTPLLLLVTNTAGDVRRFWLPLLRQARTAGFRVCCAVPAPAGGGALPALAEEAGLCGRDAGLAALRVFPLARKGLNPLRDARTCWALWHIFRQEQPQVVLAATIKCVIYGGMAWRLARAARSLIHTVRHWTRMAQVRAAQRLRRAAGARALQKAAPAAQDGRTAQVQAAPRFFAAITGLGYAFEGGSLPKQALRALVCRMYRLAVAASSGVFFQNEADVAVFRTAGILRGGEAAAARAHGENTAPAAFASARADGDAVAVRTGGETAAPASGEAAVPPAGLRPSICLTAGVGVDLERFLPAPLPPLPPDGPLIFLLAARLLLAKGIAEYAAAARLLRQRWPASAARFLLLGPLEQGAGAVTRRQLDGWLAEGALEYLGAAADVRPALRAAHVLVLPSWREGRPTVIMEGFATGRPAVLSDVPGCRETLRHGVEGLLTPPRDAPALAAALEELLCAPERVPVLAAAARRNAVRCCDARAVAAGMLAFMEGGN